MLVSGVLEVRRRIAAPIRWLLTGARGIRRRIGPRWPAAMSLGLLVLLLVSLMTLERQRLGETPVEQQTNTAVSSGLNAPTPPSETTLDGSALLGLQPTEDAAALGRQERFVAPVPLRTGTPFGWVESKTFGDWRFHPGLDFPGEPGVSVQAARSGKVVTAGPDPRWGYVVEIEHTPTLRSRYAGLSANLVVAVGDMVRQGQKIGEIGEAPLAELAEGPRLHFEIRELPRPGETGEPRDPHPLID